MYNEITELAPQWLDAVSGGSMGTMDPDGTGYSISPNGRSPGIDPNG